MPNNQAHDPRVSTAPERVAAPVGLTVAAVASGGTQATVSGSGFGAAPNVVLWRTFREGVAGQQIQAAPPSGEVGTLGLINPEDKYAEFGGRLVYQGFDGATQAGIEFVAPQTFSRFRHSMAIAVPDGSNMPGNNGYGPRTFPTDSGWKAAWAMKDGDGYVRDIGKCDLCIPSHTGGGFFVAGGNSVGLDFTRFIDNGTQADWRWNALNTFDFVCIPDLNNPRTVTGRLEARTTDAVGTTAVVRTDISPYEGTDTSINDTNCFYDRVRYNSYAQNDSGANPAQTYYTSLYLAVESTPGANDFRQCAFNGNAAVFANCTELYAIRADSWTDTEVTVSDHHGLGFYHIVKPDGSIVSGAF